MPRLNQRSSAGRRVMSSRRREYRARINEEKERQLMTNKRSTLLAECEWIDRRNEIIAAFEEFRTKHQDIPSPTGRKFFIWYKLQNYPPKEIRSIVDGRPTNEFSGGGTTNQMFVNLGFNVARLTSLPEYHRLRREGQ